MQTLWVIMLVAPLAFLIWFKIKQQTRQFVLVIVTYLVVIMWIFWLVDNNTEQVAQAESIVSDFTSCVDRSEDFDDLIICHTLLDSDVVLYNRANY